MSGHVQNNAFICLCSFPPLTPRAGWEGWASAATKNRLNMTMNLYTPSYLACSGAVRANGWLSLWQAGGLSSVLTGHSRKEHDESKQSPGRPMAGDPGSRETGFKGSACTAHDVPWAWHSHRGKNQESHTPSSKQVRLHTYTVMETEPGSLLWRTGAPRCWACRGCAEPHG